MKRIKSNIVLFLLPANIILARKLASIGQNKKEIMILIGQMVALVFTIFFMSLWVRIDMDLITNAVIITALIMIIISIVLQIDRIASMIGKES